MAYRILVADDEADIVRLLQDLFTRQGYQVLAACGGKEALELCSQKPDLILLDVNMPDMDGFTLCRQIRDFVSCPILFLTARIEDADKVMGFAAGGDDYILKPFSNQELLARVAAHLRREQRTPHARLRRGALDFDLGERAVYWKDTPLKLTRGEYAICEYLAMHPGQTFSKEQLYEAAFGYDGEADASAVTEHIKNIRAKLRPAGESPIETVWGVGYKWKNG